MLFGIRQRYWWVFIGTLALVAAAAAAVYSPVFAVRRAIVRGPHAATLGRVLQRHINLGENLILLSKKELMREALFQDSIGRVTLSYSLPGDIKAVVNQFEPAAFVMERRLYGIDLLSRIIPYDTAWKQIDLPVLTGLEVRRLFEPPRDHRVAPVLIGLDSILMIAPELYGQIAEIDFSDSAFVSIYLTTRSSRFRAVGADFTTQLLKLYAVVNGGDRKKGGWYDLQYDGMIIWETNEDKDVTDADSSRT